MNEDKKKFLYFAYGGNLLLDRIRMNTPSAIRQGIGKLNGYKLDFAYYSPRWKGSVATIVPDSDSHVWGTIWQLNISDMVNLDRQGGVSHQVFKVVNVTVETADNRSIVCRCYQLCDLPNRLETEELLPANRRPSLFYLQLIWKGAIESGLPDYYVEKLKRIPHNGNHESELQKIMIINE